MEILGNRASPREGRDEKDRGEAEEGGQRVGAREREKGRTDELWVQRWGRKMQLWADLGECSGQAEMLGRKRESLKQREQRGVESGTEQVVEGEIKRR